MVKKPKTSNIVLSSTPVAETENTVPKLKRKQIHGYGNIGVLEGQLSQLRKRNYSMSTDLRGELEMMRSILLKLFENISKDGLVYGDYRKWRKSKGGKEEEIDKEWQSFQESTSYDHIQDYCRSKTLDNRTLDNITKIMTQIRGIIDQVNGFAGAGARKKGWIEAYKFTRFIEKIGEEAYGRFMSLGSKESADTWNIGLIRATKSFLAENEK